MLDDTLVQLESTCLKALAAAGVATVKNRHVVFLCHLINGGEETHKVFLGVDIFLAVGRQQDVFTLLQAQTFMDIAGLNLCQIVMQHFSHRGTRDVCALLGQTCVSQIATGMLRVSHIHIADDVHDAAVGFLGQALVLAAVAGLHVEDGDVQALGPNHAQAAVGIAQHQHGIGLYLHHQLIAFGDDVAHCFAEIGSYSLHIHIRVGQFEILEEDPIKVVVVILSGVCQEAIEVLTAFVDNRRQTDDFGACAHNDEKLQLPVILELCHIRYFTGSKKVSGLLGLKISLQYITVTRSSVSERLMMLCVYPGSMWTA